MKFDQLDLLHNPIDVPVPDLYLRTIVISNLNNGFIS